VITEELNSSHEMILPLPRRIYYTRQFSVPVLTTLHKITDRIFEKISPDVFLDMGVTIKFSNSSGSGSGSRIFWKNV